MILQLYEDHEANYELMRQVPLRRLGDPEDMAACAAFLCSEDAAYVTGETMVAAGGMLSHL
jgi:dehydrogenase/reductase SDR family protein 4